MNKIKIAGILIFIVSIALVIVSTNISDHTKINNNLLETINKQKAFTQEISKNIFYIYKNKNCSTKQLDDSIKLFMANVDTKEERLKVISSNQVKQQSKKIVLLWNNFYLEVQNFRNQNKLTSPYISITLEKTVQNIYSLNLELIREFDKLLLLHTKSFENEHQGHKFMQYGLFFILIIILIYFLIYILKATSSFDLLIKKIDTSIASIDQIEHSAEEILDNLELTKDEDTIIQALDELMISSIKLKKLKIDLENLNNLKNKN